MAIKILIGGSPCTYWSIAQTNNRETKAEGMGWELFKNYLIAKEKFKPDLFLYENNKSAAQAIKDQIAEELGVGFDPNVRFTYINSALVSAQNRQRFYVTNFGDIEQPEDRGILLKDILETGQPRYEKSPCLDANYYKGGNLSRPECQSGSRLMACERVETDEMIPPCDPRNRDKSRTLTAGYQTCTQRDLRMDIETDGYMGKQGVVEAVGTDAMQPRYIGAVPENNGTYLNGKQPSQQYRIYDTDGKGVAVTTAAITNVAEPVNTTPDGKSQTIKAQYQNTSTVNICCYHSTYGATGVAEPVNATDDGKAIAIKAQYYKDNVANFVVHAGAYGYKSSGVAEPVNTTVEGKSYALTASYYKCAENPFSEFGEEKRRPRVVEPIRVGESSCPNDDLSNPHSQYEYCGVLGYATPCEWDENGIPTKAVSCADGKTYTVYKVVDGQIAIKGKQYPIKLADGYYIIRKLTVTECARLQTMPDDYCKAVSDSQAYKALGNGWTAEVIIHLLNHALKDVPRDEEIIVLSMYDGIATGRYCLDKMGFTNVTYHAYEIDKYPIMVAMDNYPGIIQHGDAFAVREDDWQPPQTRSEWLDDLLGGDL